MRDTVIFAAFLLLLIIAVVLLEMTGRRFPPPWSVEEQSACFLVRDHNGQASLIALPSTWGSRSFER